MRKKTKQTKPFGSHLSFEDRLTIQQRVHDHVSYRKIALELNVSPSTISKEIKRNQSVKRSEHNDCGNRHRCNKRNVCKTGCKQPCQICKRCKDHCNDYIKEQCPTQIKYGLCNGCRRLNGMCSYDKWHYDAKDAQERAESRLKDTRTGFDLTGEELEHINELVSPLIRRGQSVFHIKQTLGNQLIICKVKATLFFLKSEERMYCF